ncbi:MAG: PorV/PorQ family protein [Ignavibacteria bacterium]
MRKHYTVLILLFFGLTNLYAQLIQGVSKVGTTGATFLEIGIGARAVAMGNAFVGTANDVTALYWNPAGLAGINNEATFMHTNWFVDTKFDHASIALNLGGVGTIAIQFTSLSVSEEPVRTILQPEGTGELFDGSSVVIGIGYAYSLTDKFSIGFGAKYINESIWHSSASGFAVDIGTLFTTSLNGMRIGMSISNFGTKMQMTGRDPAILVDPDPTIAGNNDKIPAKYDTDKWDLPLILRVGVAMEIFQTDEHRFTVAADANHPNNNTEYINFGGEYGFNDMFFIRGGYANAFVKDGETDLTLGGGIKYNISGVTAVKADYSFSRFGVLGDISRIQVSLTF